MSIFFVHNCMYLFQAKRILINNSQTWIVLSSRSVVVLLVTLIRRTKLAPATAWRKTLLHCVDASHGNFLCYSLLIGFASFLTTRSYVLQSKLSVFCFKVGLFFIFALILAVQLSLKVTSFIKGLNLWLQFLLLMYFNF